MLQPDGKIIAAGYGSNFINFFFTLARYNSNGSLDTTFGTNGIVTTHVTPGNSSYINSCVLQPDGKIVAAGWGNNGGNDVFTLARYNSNGSLDTSFGTNGIVTTDVTPGDSYIYSCVLQPDGKIIAAGQGTNGNTVFALARYNSNGSLDTSFGTQGIVTNVALGNNSGIDSCVLQPDGKIVAAGYGSNGGNDVFALARYINPFSVASFTDLYGGVGLL